MGSCVMIESNRKGLVAELIVSGQKKTVIGVDLAGADVDQRSLFDACRKAVEHSSVSLRCYLSAPLSNDHPSIECRTCPDVISMKDEALSAIRKKKGSSLVQAMMDLKSGEISAVVTCAHTGAVTAAAVVYLKRFPSLHHPALVAVLPLPTGAVVALDMGAFVTATGRDLMSHAFLGSAFAKVCHGIANPRVGLLNIGRESGRGTVELRQADFLLSSATLENLKYVGNVEPSDVLSGQVDVLVTPGFSGNIFLKTAEAMMGLSRVSIDHKAKGALLAGVKGIVIKCHGSSSEQSLISAISQADQAIQQSIAAKLEHAFSAQLLI